MKQLYQNVPENIEKIQKYGCKYIELLNIYQDITQHQLVSEVVHAAYVACNRSYIQDDKGIKIPYMTKDCFVNYVSGVIQIVSGYTGIDVYMKEVDAYQKFNYRLAYMTRTTGKGEFVGHFVRVGVVSEEVIEDPWYGGSRTAKIGVIDSFRNIKARLL